MGRSRARLRPPGRTPPGVSADGGPVGLRGLSATRLILVCQGATAATRALAFPTKQDECEPLDIAARDRLRQTLGWQPHAVSAPTRAAEETAAGLAASVQVEPQLRDCDYGSWAGRSMAEIQTTEAEAFAHWLADPAAAPHGGESLADVDRRLRDWLAAQTDARGKTIAVVPALVVRALVVAALDLPLRLFWSLDAAPLGISRLSAAAGRWRLGSFNAPP